MGDQNRERKETEREKEKKRKREKERERERERDDHFVKPTWDIEGLPAIWSLIALYSEPSHKSGSLY